MTEKQKPKKNKHYHPPFSALVLISFVVVALQIMGGILIYFSIDNWADRSSFGDMFGAIGTLFSGLAFAGVIYTIMLQREELQRSVEAQAESEKAIAEQAKALAETARLNALGFLPAINCKVREDGSVSTLIMQNPSNIPAFDVDVWAVCTYSEEDLDIPTFLKKYVSEKHAKDPSYRLTSTNEGFYGVYEHLFYPIFPQKQQNYSQLAFPLRPPGVYALVQFRDIKGTNYHHLYWFFYEESENNQASGTYRLGSLNPVVPVESKRMEFAQKMEFEKIKVVPDYLIELSKFWNASIPFGILKQNQSFSVEDRGKWETL